MKTKRIFKVLVTLILSALIIFSISACDFGGNDDENEDHEHEFSTWSEGFAPTCTQDGVAPHYFCPICAKYFDADKNEIDHVIKTSGHAYGDKVTEISASCYATGVRAHYKCGTCGLLFDENKNEITELTIPKIPHDFSSEYSSDNAYHWYGCKNCSARNTEEKHTLNSDDVCTACGKSCAPTAGVLYENLGDFAIVTGYSGSESSIIIADEYEGVPVTEIQDGAFYERNDITSVVLPDTVETIGIGAFNHCKNLTSIVFSENLSVIGNFAFNYCESLTRANFPNSLKSIGESAFAYCENLISVTIGKSLEGVGMFAFEGCVKLFELVNNSENFNYKPGDSDFTYLAFYALEVHPGESRLVNENGFIFYTVPGANEILGQTETTYLIAFEGKHDGELVLPESFNGKNYDIIQYAFKSNNNLSSVVISDGVENIGKSAFWSCENLVSISLGKNVKAIESEAFFGCIRLAEIINNSNLKLKLGDYSNGYVAAFAIEIHTGESKILENGNFVFYVSEAGNYLINYTGRASEITLPLLNGKSYAINDYAFIENLFIEAVTIPDGVTSIGLAAFGYCENLKNVTMTDSVTKIAEDGFTHCYKLKNIRMSENLQELGDYAFYKCEKLQSIVLSDKLSAIGESAFYECDELYAIEFGENLKSIGEYAFFGCDSLLELNFPNGLETVGAESFRGCNSLTTLVVPDSVTSIGSCTFELCYNLIDVSLGNGLTRIESLTFMHCTKLETIVIPDGVTSIGKNAFNDCASLKSIVIPKSVTSIEESAFEYCKSLADVYYLGTEIEWSNNVDRQIGNSYLFDKATLHCQQK